RCACRRETKQRTTHVEASTQGSQDAGSIPAASILSRLVRNRKSAFFMRSRQQSCPISAPKMAYGSDKRAFWIGLAYNSAIIRSTNPLGDRTVGQRKRKLRNPDKRGRIPADVGWKQNDKGKWVQHTFYLGTDPKEA